jgi:hypothetical protein
MNYEIIDLSSILNSKIVAPAKDGNNIPRYRKTDGNEFLNPMYFPKPKERLNYFETPFEMPDRDENSYDTLCCEGQILQLPPRKYLSYNIIGNCNNGYFKEDLLFHTTSGNKFETELFIYRNWRGARGFTLEREVKNLSLAFLTKTLGNCPLGVYRYSAEMPAEEEICAVELPFNPNMNIFAITLGY